MARIMFMNPRRIRLAEDRLHYEQARVTRRMAQNLARTAIASDTFLLLMLRRRTTNDE